MSLLLHLMAPRSWLGWIIRLPTTLFLIAVGVILIEEFALNGMDDTVVIYARDVMIVALPFVALFLALLQHTARLTDRLTWLASTDQLTGLMNRRAFFHEVKRQMADSDCENTLIALDIDHFKNINDTHGHAAGDACLVRIAELLNSSIRTCDAVARTGGEEFVVFLSRTNVVQAESIAQRLVNGLKLELSPSVHQDVTLSAGLAADKNIDLNDLLKRADDALYIAKNTGRCRYVVGNSVSEAH